MCKENKRHKHADLIIAWANGAVIQYKLGAGVWEDSVNNAPSWALTGVYRIKPKPPVKKYHFAYLAQSAGAPCVTFQMYENEQQMRADYGETRFQWVERIDASVQGFPAED